MSPSRNWHPWVWYQIWPCTWWRITTWVAYLWWMWCKFWNGSSNFFSIIGAFISDSYLGRFRTLLYGCFASLLVRKFTCMSLSFFLYKYLFSFLSHTNFHFDILYINFFYLAMPELNVTSKKYWNWKTNWEEVLNCSLIQWWSIMIKQNVANHIQIINRPVN